MLHNNIACLNTAHMQCKLITLNELKYLNWSKTIVIQNVSESIWIQTPPSE